MKNVDLMPETLKSEKGKGVNAEGPANPANPPCQLATPCTKTSNPPCQLANRCRGFEVFRHDFFSHFNYARGFEVLGEIAKRVRKKEVSDSVPLARSRTKKNPNPQPLVFMISKP